MGAFLALRRDQTPDSASATASRISKCFSAQGFLGRQLIESSSWHILVYGGGGGGGFRRRADTVQAGQYTAVLTVNGIEHRMPISVTRGRN